MAVHMINRASRAFAAAPLIMSTDVVIVTDCTMTEEEFNVLQACDVTILGLSAAPGSTPNAHDASLPYDVISDREWVAYTTKAGSVLSWG